MTGISELKVALFDLDGVVVDTESQYTRFWEMIGNEYRPDIPDFAHIIKGTTLVDILSRYFQGMDTEELVKRLDLFEKDMEYNDIPGVVPFIKSLRAKGVRTAVVTSSNRAKMKSFFSKRQDLLPLFDAVFTAEDFKATKPDPDPYLHGAAAFSVSTDECVVFEDSISGMASGKAAGIYTIGLATTLPRETVEPLCDRMIDNFVGFEL